MAEDGESPGDKTYDPTPKRLEEARRKGDIARSTDLVTAGSYAGFLLFGLTFAAGVLLAFGSALQVFLADPDRLRSLAPDGFASGVLGAVVIKALLPLAPVFLLPGALALLVLVAQRAIVVTPSKLAPKLSRVSILGNAAQKFGRQGLFEFAKAAVKLSLISGVLAVFLWRSRTNLIVLAELEAGQGTGFMLALMRDFLMLVALIALVIGLFDYLWQWSDHQRRNRMSRQDLLDEIKASEGDPHMRQLRRQRGQEIATRGMLAKVPGADVVLVNPTHYAVALKWDRGSGRAPVCVAKGVDEVALAIRARTDGGRSGAQRSPDGPGAACHAGARRRDPARTLQGRGRRDPVRGPPCADAPMSRVGIQDLAALAGIEGLSARRAMAPLLARRAALQTRQAACCAGLAAAPPSADDLGLAARALVQDQHRSALRARLGEIATELAEVERALQPLRQALHRAEARSDVLKQLAADIARKDARRRARRAEEG